MEGMTREQFKRKYLDTHTELSLQDRLSSTNLCPGNISKKQLKVFDKSKKEIEKKCAEDRAEDVSRMLYDAVSVRNIEVLSKEDMPIDKLLALTIKAHPQQAQVKHTGEVAFTFADMISSASINLEKVETIDAEIDEQAE